MYIIMNKSVWKKMYNTRTITLYISTDYKMYIVQYGNCQSVIDSFR